MSERPAAPVDARTDAGVVRRARFDGARGELAAASARGAGGRHALKQYAQRMDALIQQLFADAGPASQLVGIFALGGYGRWQLCLHSDLDLLVLFAGPLGEADERFVHAFLNPLWDLGLTVGHHVREVHEGARLVDDNPEFLLALTDARSIVGDATLLEQFIAATDRVKTSKRTLDALKALIEHRHARFNDTLYQLEPDVKEAPGGLRDLFGAQTIAKLTDPALLAGGGPGARAIDDAEEFMFRVRSLLHVEVGRQHNVLGFELQDRVAERFGYGGETPLRPVERLMGDYFRHARAIDRTLGWALRAAPVPVGENLVRAADGIRFVDLREASGRPETWLSLFQTALDEGCPVTDEAIACVEANAGRFKPEDFYPTRTHRTAFLQFLRPRPGLYDRLSEMHDAGLLRQMMPEFGGISFLVVRDFYHKYTVDEHTLLTIRNLERLTDDSQPERARFARVLAEVDAPELLVLALLLHDIGKGRGHAHEVESLRLSRRVLDRLGIDGESRAAVEFLVGQHLKMSVVAFRRDTEDPEVVRQLAELVGVEDRLKMLCLMTLADVEAVSRETLTAWKEDLLWRLYVDTYNYLTLSYGDEVIEAKQAAIATLQDQRPQDLAPGEILSFVEGFPRRYLQLFSADAVYRHVRHARDLRPESVQAWLERKDNDWELTVLTWDRPFLFSNISGLLSSFGMDILRGFAFTKPNGLIVDMFHFTDDERFLALNPEGEAQMLTVLREVVSGRQEVATRLKGREQGAFRQRFMGFAPVVHVDNESSKRYTIVEIVAENGLGLLYRMSRTMSESGCDVDLVLIATEGRRAIDVFHLTRNGEKLSPAHQQDLVEALQRVLEGRV
jgi:[protein-PII] uridylyltransferase